ncbi:aldo/keto reductase [Thermodesulfobacteriota bacterium]
MIEKKAFGKTGHMSSRIIYGAAGLGKATMADTDRTFEVLLEQDINHIDVAASYADGESENRIGILLEKHRKKFFLATKTGMRTYNKAREGFHASLDRLRVDSVDLIQMHNLTDPDEWETAMGPKGALEALIEAREEGLTRFIGVTGHGFGAPDMHLKSIERYDFDSVLLPCNFLMMQRAEYAVSFNKLVSACKERDIAVQTIKSLARRPWGNKEKTRVTWYEPFEDQQDIDRAVHWVLGNSDVFLISSSDVRLLPQILNAAKRLSERPSDEEMKEMITSRDMALIFEEMNMISKK